MPKMMPGTLAPRLGGEEKNICEGLEHVKKIIEKEYRILRIASGDSQQGQPLGSALSLVSCTLWEDCRSHDGGLAKQLMVGREEVSARSFVTICSEPLLCH